MEGGVGLVSSREGHQLAEALENLTDDGVCRDGRISCMGTSFQAFGGTPLGIFAVGPGRRVGMIVRALPSVGILVVFYRYSKACVVYPERKNHHTLRVPVTPTLSAWCSRSNEQLG
ncbi:unnamed protein product [Ascophyllum nodosum]